MAKHSWYYANALWPETLQACLRSSSSLRILTSPSLPLQPPLHLNFWWLVSSNFCPLGQKLSSNAPPIFLFTKGKIGDHGFLHLDEAVQIRPWRPYLTRHSIFKDTTLVFLWRNLKPPFQIPQPRQARFKFPPSGHGQQLNARWLLVCWSFKLIGAQVKNLFQWLEDQNFPLPQLIKRTTFQMRPRLHRHYQQEHSFVLMI